MKYLCSFLLVAAILGCAPAPQPKVIKLEASDILPIKNISDLQSANEYELLFITPYKDYHEIMFAKDEKTAVERFTADVAGTKMYHVGGAFIPAIDVREIRVRKLSTRGLVGL